MIELARSSVQVGECDQMGHMNVQYYIEKSMDALAAYGMHIGLGPRALQRKGLVLEPADQHIRFLRELRPGTAYFLRGGVVRADVMALTLYTELVQTESGEVSATLRTTAQLRNVRDGVIHGFDEGARGVAMHSPVTIPPYGEPRSLPLHAPRDPALTLADADKRGLYPIFEGVVRPADCDAHGEMLPRAFMARVSDAIPNLLAQLSATDRGAGDDTGGAALEYRFIYRQRPRVGDVLAVRSGVRSVGEKTYGWGHWLFNAETGEAVASAEAIAIAMNLVTRKSIAIPAALRARMEMLVDEELMA